MGEVSCAGCGLPYGDENWIEAVVADEVWDKISVSPYQGTSILCIQCIARRCAEAELEDVRVIITAGPLRTDSQTKDTTDDSIDMKIQLKLTPMEYKLLKLLKSNEGKLVTHQEIAYKLCGETDKHMAHELSRPKISKLREKIGQEKIITAWGRGYIYYG